MRQLHRLQQFQRVWALSQGARQQTTVSELATHSFCSERHMRTLLTQWARAGWLTWQARPGRNQRGTLHFHTDPEQLRAALMSSVLDNGQTTDALALTQLAPKQLRQLLMPFLGGRWQNESPTLRIPYYRSLDPLKPGFLPGRAEQHLVRQVLGGLTRFADDAPEPQGDMAHHWQVSDDGLTWLFFLRTSLWWHSGEPVTTEQVWRRLTSLLERPALRALFSSVQCVDTPQPWCIRFQLSVPDYWLPWRLASYCSSLAHPDDDQNGCGPFRLARFQPHLVRLENHPRYHLAHPLLNAVEYWITPTLFDPAMGNSCRHPVQLAIGENSDIPHLRPVSHQISLGFCYLAIRQQGRISRAQARRLVQIIHQTARVGALSEESALITPSRAILPGWFCPQWPESAIRLPAALTLVYHLPVELHAMAEALKQRLAEEGCVLTVMFHPAKNWDGCRLTGEADLMMGDRLIGECPEYTLEQWIRCDPLWPNLLSGQQMAHLNATLDTVQRNIPFAERCHHLHQVFYQLMDEGQLTPLFNYHYQISAPPGVEGVTLNALGWFDFTKAWLPPPADGAGERTPAALP